MAAPPPHYIYNAVKAVLFSRSACFCRKSSPLLPQKRLVFMAEAARFHAKGTLPGAGCVPFLCCRNAKGSVFYGQQEIVFLAFLHEQVFSVYQVGGLYLAVEGGQFLLVEAHSAALHQLAHLAF